MKFVDVKNDIAFRKIFGNEEKTEIVISFINAVLDLPEGKKIIQVNILNPFQMPEIKGLKSSILDIRVKDQRGISYIIEMQVEEPDGFDKRVQYYTAKQYASQIEVGEDYPNLNQVIFIGILDFDFFEGTDYLTHHLIVNQSTGKQELDDLEFNFIELNKFNKTLEEIDTLVDKWIYFIKNAPNLEVIPENVKDTGLISAYENAAKHAWTKDEMESYDYASMRKGDRKGVFKKAIEKAVTKALSEADEEHEKEKKKEKVALVKTMFKANEPIEKIRAYTGLSEKEILQIIEN